MNIRTSPGTTTTTAPAYLLDCGCRYDIADADGHYCEPGRDRHCGLGCQHQEPTR